MAKNNEREEIKAIVAQIAKNSKDDGTRLWACEVWLDHDKEESSSILMAGAPISQKALDLFNAQQKPRAKKESKPLETS